MVFQKFVQIGRAVYINEGPDAGKLGVIVNILNENRVQVDGTDIQRQVIPIRRLLLTKFHLKDVLVGQRTGILRKKISKFTLPQKWAQTSYGKKLEAKKTRANLGDFERFQVMCLKKRLNRTIRTQVKKMAPKKGAKGAKGAKGKQQQKK